MNRSKFFTALRARNSGMFGTSLSTPQVKGMNAVIFDMWWHEAGAL